MSSIGVQVNGRFVMAGLIIARGGRLLQVRSKCHACKTAPVRTGPLAQGTLERRDLTERSDRDCEGQRQVGQVRSPYDVRPELHDQGRNRRGERLSRQRACRCGPERGSISQPPSLRKAHRGRLPRWSEMISVPLELRAGSSRCFEGRELDDASCH